MDSGFSVDAECREKVMCLALVVIFQIEKKEEKNTKHILGIILTTKSIRSQMNQSEQVTVNMNLRKRLE